MPMRHVPGMPMAYARMIEEFQSSVSNFDRLHDMQRRNMMALAESNKLSLDVMQAFARRQAQIMEQTTAMFADAASEMMSARNPAALAQKQLSVAHDAFRLAQAELKAFVQIAAQARDDARRIWRKEGEAAADLIDAAVETPPAADDDDTAAEANEVLEVPEAAVTDTLAATEPTEQPMIDAPVAVAVTVTETSVELPAEEPPKVIETKVAVASVARPRRSGSRRKAAS